MYQATLRTGRLRLVPLAGEHLEYEVDLDADPEVMRYLGDGRARSREDVERRHQHRLAAAKRVVGLGTFLRHPLLHRHRSQTRHRTHPRPRTTHRRPTLATPTDVAT